MYYVFKLNSYRKSGWREKHREYRCCVIPKILKMLLAIELSIGRPKKGKK